MTNDERWSACPEGTMQQLKDSLIAAEHRRALNRRTAIGAMLLTGAGACMAVYSRFGSPPRAITCHVVHQHADDYARGVANAELTAKIDAHRNSCAKCDAMLRSLKV